MARTRVRQRQNEREHLALSKCPISLSEKTIQTVIAWASYVCAITLGWVYFNAHVLAASIKGYSV